MRAGNRRRGEMSPAEARQCVGDITSWFTKKLDGELRGTNVAELERLAKSLDMELPVVFEELYTNRTPLPIPRPWKEQHAPL